MSASKDRKSQRVQSDAATEHTGYGKVKLTKAVLNAEIGKRQHEQRVIWDAEQ
jgi:hypothetical protein